MFCILVHCKERNPNHEIMDRKTPIKKKGEENYNAINNENIKNCLYDRLYLCVGGRRIYLLK